MIKPNSLFDRIRLSGLVRSIRELTLIVARVFNGEHICITSDTLLTSNYGAKARLSPDSHVLKLRIFSPNICVGFAGNDNVGDLFEELEKDPVLATVLEKCRLHSLANFAAGRPTDFLIATTEPKLYKIEDGHVVSGAINYWIGDAEAYRRFAKEEKSCRGELDEKSVGHRSLIPDVAMRIAMEQSLYGEIKSIGGFVIQVSQIHWDGGSCFQYQKCLVATLRKESLPGGEEVWGSGMAPEGGYSIQSDHIFRPYPTVLLFSFQGPSAFIFDRMHDGHLRLRAIPVEDSLDFQRKMRAIGVNWEPTLGKSLRHYAHEARELFVSGKPADAFLHLEGHLQEFPGSRELRVAKAELLLASLRSEEALQLLQSLKIEFSEEPVIERLLARAFLQLDRCDEGLQHLTVAKQLAPNDDQVKRLDLLYRAQNAQKMALSGEPEEALEVIEELLKLEEDAHWNLLRIKSMALLALGRAAEAIQLLEAVVGRPELTPQSLAICRVQLAYAFIEEGCVKKAQAIADDLLVADPGGEQAIKLDKMCKAVATRKHKADD